MRVLLIAATQFEIEPFTAGNNDAEILITGVGVPGTLYHLQKKLYEQSFDIVIQAGIAGSFTADIPPGKTVLVKQDVFADIGMEEKENFITVFQSGFADKDKHPFTDGWLINPNSIFSGSPLASVKAITLNKISDSLLQQRQFIKSYSPAIESMEGAALHYICLQEHISFMQIRSISNFVGERDKKNWKLKDAILNLNSELKNLIELLLV